MTEIKRRLRIKSIVFLALALLVGAAADAALPADKLFPIRTSTRYDCTLAPYLVADKLGFFKEEGLELVFTGELPSTEYTTAILAGETDFADHHPNALALQIYGGAKVTAVGRSIIEPEESVDPRLRHMRYYVTRQAYDAGVKTLADLGKYKEGEKLKSAGVENTCETFILNKALDRFGVSRDKLEWITVDSDVAKIQAQKLNQFDIIGVHPPFYDAAVEAGLVQIGDSADAKLGETAGVYLYYFSNEFIEKHPKEVAGFVKAMTKAQKWANENLEQTAKWTGEFIGQEVKGNHYYSETTEIDEATVLPWIEDLEKSGALPAGAIKVSDIVTHQFESK
ncbi:MAG: ABC transporter substrate-binding protein [Synergistaceae bacterium]|nr:ABC transporter substrate-binding protein [Synergistaceae bacterium]